MSKNQRFQLEVQNCLANLMQNSLIFNVGPKSKTDQSGYVNGASRQKVRELARQNARRYMRLGVV